MNGWICFLVKCLPTNVWDIKLEKKNFNVWFENSISKKINKWKKTLSFWFTFWKIFAINICGQTFTNDTNLAKI